MKNESDLAKIIITHYEGLGYETYKEVCEKGGKPRADIIATKDGEHIVLECKMSVNLKLLEQAWYWKPKSHKVFICYPFKRKSFRERLFVHQMCQDFGIGIIEVDRYNNVNIRLDSVPNNNPDLPKLFEDQKDQEAGVSSTFITPFKRTSNSVVKYINENGDSHLNDLVKNVNHHYKTDTSAKSSLKKMIKMGVIPLKINSKNIISK
jgi:hypothetical protein